MQRDMELVRKILLAIQKHESHPSTSEIAQLIKGVPPDEIVNRIKVDEQFGFQIEQLYNARIITGIDQKRRDSPCEITGLKLTWEGEDFADTVANDSVWEKTKEVLRDKGLQSAAFSVWSQVAAQQISKVLGL